MPQLKITGKVSQIYAFQPEQLSFLNNSIIVIKYDSSHHGLFVRPDRDILMPGTKYHLITDLAIDGKTINEYLAQNKDFLHEFSEQFEQAFQDLLPPCNIEFKFKEICELNDSHDGSDKLSDNNTIFDDDESDQEFDQKNRARDNKSLYPHSSVSTNSLGTETSRRSSYKDPGSNPLYQKKFWRNYFR